MGTSVADGSQPCAHVPPGGLVPDVLLTRSGIYRLHLPDDIEVDLEAAVRELQARRGPCVEATSQALSTPVAAPSRPAPTTASGRRHGMGRPPPRRDARLAAAYSRGRRSRTRTAASTRRQWKPCKTPLTSNRSTNRRALMDVNATAGKQGLRILLGQPAMTPQIRRPTLPTLVVGAERVGPTRQGSNSSNAAAGLGPHYANGHGDPLENPLMAHLFVHLRPGGVTWSP